MKLAELTVGIAEVELDITGGFALAPAHSAIVAEVLAGIKGEHFVKLPQCDGIFVSVLRLLNKCSRDGMSILWKNLPQKVESESPHNAGA